MSYINTGSDGIGTNGKGWMMTTDMETCSWCCTEVPDSTLREIPGSEGARLCRACRRDVAEANR